MATHKRINDMAKKWLEMFQNEESKLYELESKDFGNDFYAQEFDADKADSFEERYPGALHDLTIFKSLVDSIDDVQFLGNGIYSKWRYVTHWETDTDLLSPKNREWLILALSRLVNLTND